MSNLSLVEATLPPGFRFHPRDEELICDYLFNKLSLSYSPLLVEIDLNKCEPWDLPETACVGGKEWYFYSQRDRKYATGLRTNRATVSGYWKATGKDRSILRNRTLVGMRKTLVFYLGRAPKGKKTNWVMHEFRLQDPKTSNVDSSIQEDWVLCRVFCKDKDIRTYGKQNNNNVGISINKYEGQHEDTQSCSTSLPPLTEPPYTLSFDQSQPKFTTSNTNNTLYNQQVPCFSTIFNPQLDTINPNHHHLFSTTIPPPPPPPPPSITIPSALSLSSSHCCEKKDVIQGILSRFNMDKQISFNEFAFGDGSASDQSFLSDASLPVTMWYP